MRPTDAILSLVLFRLERRCPKGNFPVPATWAPQGGAHFVLSCFEITVFVDRKWPPKRCQRISAAASPVFSSISCTLAVRRRAATRGPSYHFAPQVFIVRRIEVSVPHLHRPAEPQSPAALQQLLG